MQAVFLDRDGTINYGVPRYERVDSVDKVELIPNALEGLTKLAESAYRVFIFTNQAGLAEGLISWDDFNQINDKVKSLAAPSGLKIEETLVCPHGEEDGCDCRKPKPKLLTETAKKYGIDLSKSWMIGDRPSDVDTGINAGMKTILVRTGAVNEYDKADFVAKDLLEAVEHVLNT